MNSTTTALPFGSALHQAGKGWTTPLPKHLNSPRTLVLAFSASGLASDAPEFETLRSAFPDSVITGCSTSGEIHDRQLTDASISVGVFRFREGRVRAAHAPVRSAADSCRAGVLIAEQLTAPDLRAVLIFSDGLNVNGTELVKGLASSLDPGVVITGGLAGDGTAFKRTWVLHAGRHTGGVVTAVGLYGSTVRVGHGSKGGWDPFGPERLVTRSAGNVLFELDGQPALPLYKKYLGDRATGLPATALLFPLAIRSSNGDSQVLVRTILGVDEAANSLTFAGDIPEGSVAQLMRANFDRLIGGAGQSAVMARDGVETQPCLCVAVSCVGRRLVLGQRTEEELDAVFSTLPAGSSQVGFYSYGEISPIAAGSCDLHNQTMTVTTIGEA